MATIKGAIARLKRPFLPNLERRRYHWLREHIKADHGVFVEAGANNGISQSNTLYLERAGWTGLLIEPVPALAALARQNRSAPVVECALVPPDMNGKTISMTYANLMSFVDGALKSPDGDAAQLRNALPHIGIGESYRLDVEGRTLASVLDVQNISHIDLLCIDIEGFEAPALRGLDFTRYQPTWMLIECRFRDDVEAVLSNRYKAIDQIGAWDVLYQSL